VVRELLAREDINPNAIAEHNYSKTPLHIAAEKESLGIVQALLKSAHMIHINAGDSMGNTALHHAAVGENEEVVVELLNHCKLYDLDNAPKNKTRASPLHLAAVFGRYKTVSKLLAAGLPVNKTALSRHTPLHFAVHSGSWETVKVLLQESEDLKVSEADWKGLTPVEYARQACKTNKNGFRPAFLPLQENPREDAQRMMQMLEFFDVKGLRNNRQSHVDAANAILVGAALIASIAFASWLQPPLGFQPNYSSQFLELSPAAPPNTYLSFVYFHSNAMKAFWVFNSISFFFAIGSFLLGAAVGLPTRYTLQAVANQEMHRSVTKASFFLIVAVACIVVAFICAGFADLPTIPQDWRYMIATAVAGAIPCVIGMEEYYRRIRGRISVTAESRGPDYAINPRGFWN
jgi:hypothetical protein